MQGDHLLLLTKDSVWLTSHPRGTVSALKDRPLLVHIRVLVSLGWGAGLAIEESRMLLRFSA